MCIRDRFIMECAHPYPLSFRKRSPARAEVREEAAMSSSSSDSLEHATIPPLPESDFNPQRQEAVENRLPSRYHIQEQVASGTDELERCSVGEISDSDYPESVWYSTNVSAEEVRMMRERVKLVSARLHPEPCRTLAGEEIPVIVMDRLGSPRQEYDAARCKEIHVKTQLTGELKYILRPAAKNHNRSTPTS